MISKKLELKRVIIYLLISFAPSWIVFFIYRSIYGLNINTALYFLIGIFAMLMPSVSMILTRLITKEGFDNTFLKVNLKGNIKYYVIGLFTPFVYSTLGAFLVAVFLMPKGTISEIISNLSLIEFITLVVYLASISVLLFIPALGEEIGWRGYLTPKLEKLTNTKKSLILSGIIWGIWHAPMIAIGHNFGTDYDFFPYSGIFLMIIYCSALGIFYTLLTKKTNSVFPSAISHSANNDGSGVIFSIIISQTNNAISKNAFVTGIPRTYSTASPFIFSRYI